MLSQDNKSTNALRERSLSFTLGTALAWLGHDCPGICPREVTGHHAAVWFTHLRDVLDQDSGLTLVEVDFGEAPWSGPRRNLLLDEINRCVRFDGLIVHERLGYTLAGTSDTGLPLHE